MATTAAPYGLRPVSLIGSRYNTGGFRLMKIASGYNADIGFGDPVVLNAGYIQRQTGMGDNATLKINGIFVGCQYTQTTGLKYFLTQQSWTAGTVATDAFAFVVEDPDVLFQIQADGAVVQAKIGQNANFAGTSNLTPGPSAAGDSTIALSASSIATTAALPVRIVDFVRGPFSEPGDTYTDVLCKWNFGIHAFSVALGQS